MNNLAITRAFCALPLAMSLFLLNASAQTTTYSTAGVYTNVAPAGVGKVTFKLWGAGGGGGGFSFIGLVTGGGGAFSSVTLDAQPGDAFVIVVGQRGAFSSAALGGVGSGNTQGGPSAAPPELRAAIQRYQSSIAGGRPAQAPAGRAPAPPAGR